MKKIVDYINESAQDDFAKVVKSLETKNERPIMRDIKAFVENNANVDKQTIKNLDSKTGTLFGYFESGGELTPDAAFIGIKSNDDKEWKFYEVFYKHYSQNYASEVWQSEKPFGDTELGTSFKICYLDNISSDVVKIFSELK